jgi:arsenate reductase
MFSVAPCTILPHELALLWHECARRGTAALLYSAGWIHLITECPMSEYTIYHNPRCSKSRNTLALLQENGIEPEVILYLETCPDADEIRDLLDKLGIGAGQLVRKGEDAYKECGLGTDSSDGDILAAMAGHPKLIERPIVVRGDRAVLGRPPENVLGLIG